MADIINDPLIIEHSSSEIKHFILLDNNVFRWLKRHPHFLQPLHDLLMKEECGKIFDNFVIDFPWMSMLEDINRGKILSNLYKNKELLVIIGKFKHLDFNNQRNINNFWDNLFEKTVSIVRDMPELRPDIIKEQVQNSLERIKEAEERAKEAEIIGFDIFIKAPVNRFLKIDLSEYLDDLYYQIAWSFLVSYEFIKKDTCDAQHKRSCYDCLIKIWHNLFLKGYTLDFYRLIDRYSHSLEQDPYPQSTTKIKLKPESDLLDGVILTSIGFGAKIDKKNVPFMAITGAGSKEAYSNSIKKNENRMKLLKTRIQELQQVKGWHPKLSTGKMIVLDFSSFDRGKGSESCHLIDLEKI